MRLQVRELAQAPNSAIVFGPAIRWRGLVFVGGQQYFTEPDERDWVESRLVYNQDRNYSGFWACRPCPLRSTASDLSIEGAEYFSIVGGPGGFEDTAKVPAGRALAASWLTAFPDRVGPRCVFESVVVDAQTGQRRDVQLPAGNLSGRTRATLPALAPGSYLWHVRISDGEQPYTWPPPDYARVTGRPVNDLEFSWRHPTLGQVFYNPFYNVGLVPFDPAHPLRALHEQARRNGQVVKHPSWVTFVTTADEAGDFATTAGEYASLRLIVGAGTPGGDANGWVGDREVPEAATAAGACLWTVPNPGPAGTCVPLTLDPTARICGGFYAEPERDGGLWVGLMLAGRNGRATRLLRLAPDWEDGDSGGLMHTTGAINWCECALSNESITSIARYPDRPLERGGKIHALTFCSRLLLQPLEAPKRRLLESHPGGRSFTHIPDREGGDGLLIYHTESDFAVSPLHPWAFNFILGDGPRGVFVGKGSAHHAYDNLARWQGAAYFVEEALGEDAPSDGKRYFERDDQLHDNRQHLVRYDGAMGVRLASWGLGRYDLGALAAAGPNLVVTGTTAGVPGATMRPMAISFNGSAIRLATDFRYWVRRIAATISDDGQRQVAMFTAYKENAQAPGTPLSGFFVGETTGEPARVVFTCSDPENTGEPCPCVCVPLQVLYDQGYSYDELPEYLVWDAASRCWRGADSCSPPELPPGAPCLRLHVGEEDVCYCLEEGDWPYNTERYDGIELTDLTGCWPPVGDPDRPPVVFLCSDPEHTGEPCPCVCVEESVLFDAGYSYDELPPYLVWDAATNCWRGADACLPDGSACLKLFVGEGVICYCLESGDWPYDTDRFNGIALDDPTGCWPPVGPDCDNAGDCYENFPPGSRVGSVVLNVRGELGRVIVSGARANSRQANAVGDLRDATRFWPWLWLGVDVELPLGIVEGQDVDDATLEVLRQRFRQRAYLGREVGLALPARENVVLVFILPPGIDAKMALAPR